MAEPPIDVAKLLELVDQILHSCTETTATTAALASLLIGKGYITEEEFASKIAEQAKMTEKIAKALDSATHDA